MGEVKEGLNQKDGGRGLAIGGGSPGSLNNLQYQFGVSMGRLVFGSAGFPHAKVRPRQVMCSRLPPSRSLQIPALRPWILGSSDRTHRFTFPSTRRASSSSLQRVIRPLTPSSCQVDIRRGDSPYRGRLMWFQEMTCGRLVGLAH
ncbi:hypothetical protein BHM03_00004640 [Ensete ventricosum]|nr:hypothetical protein BHM03_00004640 [Ensete ventricosum]